MREMFLAFFLVLGLPYFLEIPPPSKSRRTYKEVGSNKRRPRNLAAWKRVVGFKVSGMQAHAAIRTIEMDESTGARRVSGLVAALEISPQGAAT